MAELDKRVQPHNDEEPGTPRSSTYKGMETLHDILTQGIPEVVEVERKVI